MDWTVVAKGRQRVQPQVCRGHNTCVFSGPSVLLLQLPSSLPMSFAIKRFLAHPPALTASLPVSPTWPEFWRSFNQEEEQEDGGRNMAVSHMQIVVTSSVALLSFATAGAISVAFHCLRLFLLSPDLPFAVAFSNHLCLPHCLPPRAFLFF